MSFLQTGFARDDLHRCLQVLCPAGNVGIAARAARLAVIFMVHRPDVETPAGKYVHHRIFAVPGRIEIENAPCDGRAMNKKQHWTRGFAGSWSPKPLAEHE